MSACVMRSVVRSNGLRNGDIPSSSSPALVMPLGEKADMLRDDLLDPTGPAAGAMEFCPHPVLVTVPERNFTA